MARPRSCVPLAKWLPPHRFTCRVESLDAWVMLTFTAVSCGTELRVVREGIPDLIPEGMSYLGWQESPHQLARRIEPAIPH